MTNTTGSLGRTWQGKTQAVSAALVNLGQTDGRLSGEEMLVTSSLVRIYLNAPAMQAMARSLVLCSMQGQSCLDRESLVFSSRPSSCIATETVRRFLAIPAMIRYKASHHFPGTRISSLMSHACCKPCSHRHRRIKQCRSYITSASLYHLARVLCNNFPHKKWLLCRGHGGYHQ